MQELQRQASQDPLTGLKNRRRFEEDLRAELARSRRDGTTGALLMLDLDHFKQVNDTLGHPAGDRVIDEIAGVLRRPHPRDRRAGADRRRRVRDRPAPLRARRRPQQVGDDDRRRRSASTCRSRAGRAADHRQRRHRAVRHRHARLELRVGARPRPTRRCTRPRERAATRCASFDSAGRARAESELTVGDRLAGRRWRRRRTRPAEASNSARLSVPARSPRSRARPARRRRPGSR